MSRRSCKLVVFSISRLDNGQIPAACMSLENRWSFAASAEK
jgi:hypothetical protein